MVKGIVKIKQLRIIITIVTFVCLTLYITPLNAKAYGTENDYNNPFQRKDM
jgi:hypothetical protein